MVFEQKPDSGSLFKNDERRSETDASHTGSALIGGQRFRISAWVNETRDGKKYFKLSFRQQRPH
jgi:hypothetical protein